MKTKIRYFLATLLSALLAFNPLVMAQTEEQVQAHPELQDDLEYDTYLIRTYLLQQYENVKTVPDFISQFAQERPRGEKEKIQKLLSALPQLPTMEPMEFGLKISMDSQVFKIDMRDLKKNRFMINQVPFTFDPGMPWTTQAEILKQKLERSGNGNYGVLFGLMIPEAHAFGPLVMAALTTVVTSIAGTAVTKLGPIALDAVKKGVCKVVNKIRKSRPAKNPIICKKGAPAAGQGAAPKKVVTKKVASKKKPDPKAKDSTDKSEAKKPEEDDSDEEEQADTKELESEQHVIQLENEKCPSGAVPTFDADLKILNNSKERRAKVQAKYSAGKIKEVNLYEEVPNPKTKDGKEVKVLATYILTKDSAVDEILIPKTELGTDAANDSKVPTVIRIKGNEESKDEAVQNLKEYHQNLLQYVGERAATCRLAVPATPVPATKSGTKTQGSRGTH